MPDLFTTLHADFRAILGVTANTYTDAERRKRWAAWLKAARRSGSEGKDAAKHWLSPEGCGDCPARRGGWCLYMGLPAAMNPVLTFRHGVTGMACMGVGPTRRARTRT